MVELSNFKCGGFSSGQESMHFRLSNSWQSESKSNQILQVYLKMKLSNFFKKWTACDDAYESSTIVAVKAIEFY